MRVLVLGDGLLGKELVNQTGWEFISRKKDGFDITDLNTFNLMLETYDGVAQMCNFDVIINCIGAIKPQVDKISKSLSILINSVFPNMLALVPS